jgi:hypothetical protein
VIGAPGILASARFIPLLAERIGFLLAGSAAEDPVDVDEDDTRPEGAVTARADTR